MMILTLSPEAKDSRLADFRSSGVKCYSLGLSRVAGALLGSRLLKQFLREHPADIIHASDIRSSVVAAMGPKNIPRIITRRESFYKHSILYQGIIYGSILEAIHSAACHRVDKVITVSEFVRESAGRSLRSNIDVIPNAVDIEKFTPASATKRKQMRNRLFLPIDKRVFITTGWLSEFKDPLSIIKGFLSSRVAEQSMLLLVGEGSLRGKCERMANRHSNVRFVGFVNNVVEYLQSSDFFISSSLNEGLPNGVLEALACGLPVILSDIKPHREILAFNPIAGKLFPVKDVPALATCLQEITNNDYPSRSEAAFQIVQQHLNARRMSAQYEALYVNVIQNKKVGGVDK